MAGKPLYDLIVLGAGPAGLEAARVARRLSLRVALVERSRLGGNSLNTGSVPSKSIIRSGRALNALIDGYGRGAPTSSVPKADIGAVMRRMRRIRARIAEYHSAQRMEELGVEMFAGSAHFDGARSVRIGATSLKFKKAVIATGARPRPSAIPGLESTGYLTSETVFDIVELPKRLAVIGGGPLGCELAQAFSQLGSWVTILQNEPKFLPREERDAAELLSMSLARCGVETRLNTPLVDARAENGEKIIDVTNGGAKFSITVDEILLSVGRVPNTEDLNLDSAGIKVDAHHRIDVDDFFRSTNPNVYAAGDACMAHKYTNVAQASARLAVLNACAGETNRLSRLTPPWCTYCDPEIAHIGLHALEARRRSIPIKSFTVMMQDVDRAIIDGKDAGFVKIHVKEGTDEILGATVVGSRASELINELSVVMSAGIGMRRLADVLHAYPSQSDAIRLAAAAFRDDMPATPQTG
jgi:pyruvate/2-oxoglutarate dehydrogenase complex dihydrolipoamide dehydrogenase (E3) component